jgi:hypothetical protein
MDLDDETATELPAMQGSHEPEEYDVATDIPIPTSVPASPTRPMSPIKTIRKPSWNMAIKSVVSRSAAAERFATGNNKPKPGLANNGDFHIVSMPRKKVAVTDKGPKAKTTVEECSHLGNCGCPNCA